MIRLLPLLLVLAACAPSEAPPSPRGAVAGATPELQRICTQEAERVVNFRERGQLMRADSNERVVIRGSHTPACWKLTPVSAHLALTAPVRDNEFCR